MPWARWLTVRSGINDRSVDFIQKHIFPGGFLPSVTCLVDSLLAGSKGKLVIEQIENIGPRALPPLPPVSPTL